MTLEYHIPVLWNQRLVQPTRKTAPPDCRSFLTMQNLRQSLQHMAGLRFLMKSEYVIVVKFDI